MNMRIVCIYLKRWGRRSECVYILGHVHIFAVLFIIIFSFFFLLTHLRSCWVLLLFFFALFLLWTCRIFFSLSPHCCLLPWYFVLMWMCGSVLGTAKRGWENVIKYITVLIWAYCKREKLFSFYSSRICQTIWWIELLSLEFGIEKDREDERVKIRATIWIKKNATQQCATLVEGTVSETKMYQKKTPT